MRGSCRASLSTSSTVASEEPSSRTSRHQLPKVCCRMLSTSAATCAVPLYVLNMMKTWLAGTDGLFTKLTSGRVRALEIGPRPLQRRANADRRSGAIGKEDSAEHHAQDQDSHRREKVGVRGTHN